MDNVLFAGIDIGTQGTKGVLTDRMGNTVSEAFVPSVLEHPETNAVTENPERIVDSVISVIRKTVEKSGRDGKEVRAVCIDGQMAGILGVDEDFRAVTPLDSWLDNRCAKYTELLRQKAGNSCLLQSGGQFMNAHAPKILWWKHERPDAYAKIKKFIMPNAYAAGCLCGLKAEDAFMDYTFLHFNLFSDNLKKGFCASMLKDFGVEPEKMPKIVSPQTVVGTVTAEFAAECGISPDVKVLAGCGDTAASALGSGIVDTGIAQDVAGTASVFACCTDRFIPDVTDSTLLYSRSVIDGQFLPLSYITGGGLTLIWFSKLCGKELNELDLLAERAPAGSGGVTFIPHFSGRTFPFDISASGAFMGLNTETSAGDMFRAILEAIAFEYRGFLDIMVKNGCLDGLKLIRGVGGGAKSRIFSRIKADVLGADYLACEHICSAPEAMAKLAALSCGYTDLTVKEVFGSSDAGRRLPFDESRHKAYTAAFDLYMSRLYGYLKSEKI